MLGLENLQAFLTLVILDGGKFTSLTCFLALNLTNCDTFSFFWTIPWVICEPISFACPSFPEVCAPVLHSSGNQSFVILQRVLLPHGYLLWLNVQCVKFDVIYDIFRPLKAQNTAHEYINNSVYSQHNKCNLVFLSWNGSYMHIRT